MTDGGSTIKVLICDDVAELRALYRAWLEREADMDLVGEAADGEEAINLTAELAPDVVLLDVHMPVKDGFEALDEITAAHPATKVIMLTGFQDDALKQAAAERGAADYVVKGTPLGEVADRIRSVSRR